MNDERKKQYDGDGTRVSGAAVRDGSAVGNTGAVGGPNGSGGAVANGDADNGVNGNAAARNTGAVKVNDAASGKGGDGQTARNNGAGGPDGNAADKNGVAGGNGAAGNRGAVTRNGGAVKGDTPDGASSDGTGRDASADRDDSEKGRGRKPSGGFNRPSRRRVRKQQKSEFDSRVLSARRVSRVVAGGRRFSLSVAVAVGNGSGKVGVGVSKGQDMASAMDKARHQAQRNVMQIPLTEDKGIPHEAVGKYCASVVHLRPARGFVAGGAVRTVAELAGIQRLNAKIQSRSKSHLNNARAVLRAFESMKQ